MHNIESPRADDSAIEQEIQSKGLIAPRITPADIEANIDSWWYFTAAEGCEGAAAAGTPYELQPPVGASSPLRLLTFCVLVLRNGFTVVGKSACASAENFDADIGRKVARADAVNQTWPLMGYELRTRLQPPPAQAPMETTLLDRLRTEHADLRERIGKLQDFLGGARVVSVPVEQVVLMGQQLSSMRDYEARLRDRLVWLDA